MDHVGEKTLSQNRIVGNVVTTYVIIVRLLVGCIFLWSATTKLHQPSLFLEDVYGYELVGPAVGLFIAITLPWFELFVAICLLLDFFVVTGFIGTSVLGLVFLVATISAVYRGLQIHCGCFGRDSEIIGYGTILRSALLLVLALTGIFFCFWLNNRQRKGGAC